MAVFVKRDLWGKKMNELIKYDLFKLKQAL